MVVSAFKNTLPRGVTQKYSCDPPISRFAHSLQFTQTNFQFGHSPACRDTSYRADYWRDAHLSKNTTYQAKLGTCGQVGPVVALTPSSQQLHQSLHPAKACSDLGVKSASAVKDSSQPSSCPLGGNICQSPTAANAAGHVEELKKSKKKVLQKNNFSFGNDPAERSTAYREFAGRLQPRPRRPSCPPPAGAEILPVLWKSMPERSMVHDDFAYIGRDISQKIYSSRYNSLSDVKSLHTTDAVGQALFNRKRPLLSCSQHNYRPPVEQLHGNVTKQLMVQNISPAVRQDSIWASVNNGGSSRILSEHCVNYTWPLADKGMKRFFRGHCNRVR